jgi:hypothetical protein
MLEQGSHQLIAAPFELSVGTAVGLSQEFSQLLDLSRVWA